MAYRASGVGRTIHRGRPCTRSHGINNRSIARHQLDVEECNLSERTTRLLRLKSPVKCKFYNLDEYFDLLKASKQREQFDDNIFQTGIDWLVLHTDKVVFYAALSASLSYRRYQLAIDATRTNIEIDDKTREHIRAVAGRLGERESWPPFTTNFGLSFQKQVPSLPGEPRNVACGGIRYSAAVKVNARPPCPSPSVILTPIYEKHCLRVWNRVPEVTEDMKELRGRKGNANSQPTSKDAM